MDWSISYIPSMKSKIPTMLDQYELSMSKPRMGTFWVILKACCPSLPRLLWPPLGLESNQHAVLPLQTEK